jgi:hypothetical protein
MLRKDMHNRNYKNIINSLCMYEYQNIEYYTDSDLTKRVITHPSAGDMKDQAEFSIGEMKNPYKDAYIWLKGELLDLMGMVAAMNGREYVQKLLNACEDKKRKD